MDDADWMGLIVCRNTQGGWLIPAQKSGMTFHRVLLLHLAIGVRRTGVEFSLQGTGGYIQDWRPGSESVWLSAGVRAGSPQRAGHGGSRHGEE